MLFSYCLQCVIAAATYVHVAFSLKTFAAYDMDLDIKLAKQKLEAKTQILTRFSELDGDGDGLVTMSELRAGFGFGEEDMPRTDIETLHRMLMHCNPMLTLWSAGAPCHRSDLEAALDSFMSSPPEEVRTSLLQVSKPSNFDLAHLGEDCGAAGMDAGGGEKVKCTWQGEACLPKQDPLLAWGFKKCDLNKRACICEATSQTKRLAKVGLAGAIAVGTVWNYSDPAETLRTPDCGDGWEAIKHVDYLRVHPPFGDGIKNGLTTVALALKIGEDWGTRTKVWNSSEAGTEVGFFKTASHQVTRGGPKQKVCMFSWQATRSWGDWKSNFMLEETKFPYGPAGHEIIQPYGLVQTYKSVRENLKARFEHECCNPDFVADKVIISGHSHGGAMAEMHAIDVVTNWKCQRDLGAKDIAAFFFAPHRANVPTPTYDKVFSCNDTSKCLAGSTAVIYTKNDHVGDPTVPMVNMNIISKTPALSHPAKQFSISCPEMPATFNSSQGNWWCHNLGNYRFSFEEELVDTAGWGSSCGGVCGDPNPSWQCNEIVSNFMGCNYATPEFMKNASSPTHCPATAWQADKEKCACPVDPCFKLNPGGNSCAS